MTIPETLPCRGIAYLIRHSRGTTNNAYGALQIGGSFLAYWLIRDSAALSMDAIDRLAELLKENAP